MIAQWAALHDVPLIHFSTDYVFNGTGDRAWREDDEAQPLSVYGSTKLAGENAVRAAGGTSLIIRTSWVYAAQGTNFLRAISRLARERKELRIVADQIGAPTSAAVIADGVIEMLSPGLDKFSARCGEANGLVHLVASGETSWHGFAVAIVEGLKERKIAACGSNTFGRSQAPNIRPARNVRITRGSIFPACTRSLALRPLHWKAALAPELDALARELSATSRIKRGG